MLVCAKDCKKGLLIGLHEQAKLPTPNNTLACVSLHTFGPKIGEYPADVTRGIDDFVIYLSGI